ncbi:VapC toxin family PIN domain ribonuclease [Moraxella caviae]|uniref:Probable ribonuclease FitB n=1 Tax=Moraxella caviae TaxID=34060 RepID=A0A1T0A847_9GAMM|nr:type II toxin-antitoxin system VapC family toxin [Moraxella caviae]OOR91903.1 VapC toxin family PIN domain ribonuclease [Moraxella caviae]STZ09757.1 Probable ribonuclease FitB [Moraxella caviae]
MYLLDTNAVSEIRKVQKGVANAGFDEWLASIDYRDLYLSVVVLMELERGVLGMERKDVKQGKYLRTWLEQSKKMYQGRILPITERTADICASFHVPNKAPENDAWIAACAKEHGLILVTRNVADFADLPVAVINPFTAE